MLKRLIRNRKGQGFVEYALLIAGVALVGAIGVTMLGEKTNEMIAAVATVLPAGNELPNNPIVAGAVIEYDVVGPGGELAINLDAIFNHSNAPRLSDNVGTTDTFIPLVVEIHPY